MRQRIYEIIEVADENDYISHIYDIIMIVVILASIIPLGMKDVSDVWLDIEDLCVTVFIFDYCLRLLTADYKLNDHSFAAFVKYPFTPMAIIDIVSILPHFILINSGFGLLRLLRLARALRVVRIAKIFRYSKNIEIILSVIRRSKDSLITVGALTLAYIVTSALVMMNVEPDSFSNFFEAVYWATISLTTIGYGDILPVTAVGKTVTMLSAFFGVAVIALPAGIITAGYMQEIQYRNFESRREKRRKKKADDFHVRD